MERDGLHYLQVILLFASAVSSAVMLIIAPVGIAAVTSLRNPLAHWTQLGRAQQDSIVDQFLTVFRRNFEPDSSLIYVSDYDQ